MENFNNVMTVYNKHNISMLQLYMFFIDMEMDMIIM